MQKAPDRYLTPAERMAVRTSKRWVAGYPQLVAQWHPKRNVDLYPYEVPAGSNHKVWWKCPKGPDHEWEATPNNRVPKPQRPRGSGCPFCAGDRLSVTTCLAAVRPKLAAEWHPTKNGKLTPKDVRPGDDRSVWWKCPKGPDHVFRQTIAARSKGRTGCPFCRNRKLSVTNSIAAKLPALAREWHPTKNGRLTPRDVRAADVRKPFWWICTKAPGSRAWRASIAARRAGAKCPFCTSFAAKHPRLLAMWHPTKNGSLDPWTFKTSSTQSAWWKCSRAKDHVWRSSIKERTAAGSGACPFCSRRAVSSTNSLAALFPAIARQWHPTKNGRVTADTVPATRHAKAWWLCRRGHEWTATIGGRTRRGVADCPVCEGRRASADTSLAATHPAVARYWSPRNAPLAASDVTAKSDRQVWWRCRKSPEHEWTDRVHQRVAAKNSCPFCAGLRRSETTTLAVAAPDLARQWHQTKNGKLRPATVHVAEPRRVWWQCDGGPDHEWQTRLDQRVRTRRGCPFCGGWRFSVTTSFGFRFPKLANELHPTRNGSLDPMTVKQSSTEKVWWRCSVDPSHEWRASFHYRTARRSACPFCVRAQRARSSASS